MTGQRLVNTGRDWPRPRQIRHGRPSPVVNCKLRRNTRRAVAASTHAQCRLYDCCVREYVFCVSFQILKKTRLLTFIFRNDVSTSRKSQQKFSYQSVKMSSYTSLSYRCNSIPSSGVWSILSHCWVWMSTEILTSKFPDGYVYHTLFWVA